MERSQDWLRKAERDLEHARNSLSSGYYEWACFAAHQSAEKAVKALFQKLAAEAWGHSVAGLLEELPGKKRPEVKAINRAKRLDKHYFSSRYPNLHPKGAPADYYTQEEAQQAIEDAENILLHCKSNLL